MTTIKTFQDFLAESQKTFEFKVWFSNADLSPEDLDKLETALQKYKLSNISKPKSQPTTEHQFFPGQGAVELSTIEIELSYPCNATQVYDVIVRSGIPVPGRNVVVMSKSQAEGQDATHPAYDQYPPAEALLNSSYEDSDNSELVGEKRAMSLLKSFKSREFELAANAAPTAKTTNDIPQGTKSPVGSTKVNRTVPKTGRNK